LRGSIRKVSYRPRPPTNSEERPSDARVNRFFGEQLDGLRHDGADVSAGTAHASRSCTHEGRADVGAAAEAGKEAEGVETEGEEKGREEAAQGQSEAGGYAEEGVEKASPLAQLEVIARERLFGWLSAISSRRSRGTFPSPCRRSGTIRMRHRGRWWRSTFMLLVACTAPKVAPGNPQAEISTLLERSAADWNHGDLSGFMNDYAKDSLTSYVTRGHVQYGWQALYDRYQKTYFAPGQHRDCLAFTEVRVRPLTPDLALCTARFELRRGDSVTASGPFTLVLQKRGDRWLILHDHTSPDPK